MKLKTLAAALGLSLVIGSAAADPISGTASLNGFFGSLSASANAVVNDLNAIDVNPAALVGATTGDFVPDGAATATDFSIVPALPGMIYSFNGFTFNVTTIMDIVRTALSCGATGCTDGLVFNIGGVVTGGGFDATAFTGIWTGNGSCQQAAVPLTCISTSKSGSWSVSLTAIGQRIPEPGSLALLGIGLAALGFASRRKA